MKRIFNFIFAVSFVGFIFNFHGTANGAASITLSSENLANALGEAVLWNSEGKVVSADVSGASVSFKIVSGDTETSVDVKYVALIEFSAGDSSKAVKDADFTKDDIAKFTGLKSLSLNNCTELTTIDLSENSTIEILDISNLTNLKTVKANNMAALKAVGLARVELESTSSLADMLGGNGNTGSTPAIASLSSNILEKLIDLDLSDNPKLSGVGYVLTQTENDMSDLSSMLGGNGSSTSTGESKGESKVTKYGYKIHSVLTTLKKDTTFLKADKSYSEEPAEDNSGFSFGGFLTGTNGNVLGTYSDKTVNLLPALKTFNLKNSGTTSTSYINDIDIEDLTALTSADFSKMTKLTAILLPAGDTLKKLDLTGDTALTAIDLSYTKGFLYPTGFWTLTGLTDLRIYERNDIDSIDVSPFTKLTALNLTNNRLTSLDISKNPELVTLYIGNNTVKELNLDAQTKIRSLDISNNSLIKIDLSKNINMRVHKNDTDSFVRLSNQKRLMTTEAQKSFDFKEIYPRMTPVERASIVWDSIAGNGQKADSVDVDVDEGVVSFKYFPTVITYDYKSGKNYENSSEPLCMTVELRWDITDEDLQQLRDNDTDKENEGSTNAEVSGSGGGCNAGIGVFTLLIWGSLAIFIKRN